MRAPDRANRRFFQVSHSRCGFRGGEVEGHEPARKVTQTFGETLRCACASPNGARGREQLAALAPLASAELLTGADTAARLGPVLVAQVCGLPTARGVPLTSRPITRRLNCFYFNKIWASLPVSASQTTWQTGEKSFRLIGQ